MRSSIKDDVLADCRAAIELQSALSAAERKRFLRAAVEEPTRSQRRRPKASAARRRRRRQELRPIADLDAADAVSPGVRQQGPANTPPAFLDVAVDPDPSSWLPLILDVLRVMTP